MQDAPIPPAAEKLAREMAAWTAVDLRVRVDYPKMAGGPTFTDRFHLIEQPGRVRLQGRVRPAEQPQATFVGVEALDGDFRWSSFHIEESGRSSLPAIRTGEVRGLTADGTSLRPEPLRYWYFGEDPLPKAMADAHPIGVRTILGRTVDVFRLVARPGLNSARSQAFYWLDRETGIPLRFESFYHWPPHPNDPPGEAWEATAFEPVGGRLLPTRSELRTLKSSPGAAPVETLAHTTTVESVALGGRHPDSTFRPDPTTDAYPVIAVPAAPAVPLRAVYPQESPRSWWDAVGLLLIAATLVLGYLILRPIWLDPKRVRSKPKEEADLP